MTVEELDSIVTRLDSICQNKKHIQLAKAQAEIDAINLCATAYYDGLYDMAKEVAKLLHKEKQP
jgi:hypothetical protein